MIVTVHTLSGGTITDHFKGGREMLPKDPHMLASFLNLKLRDFYPSLDALCDASYDVVGVFTQPDRPAGRGKKLTACPVKVILILPVFTKP